MKYLADYIQRIRKASTLSEFPAKKDSDYTVTFVQPETGSSEGIYRTLLPAMHLTNNTTIRCIPICVTDQVDSLSINQKDCKIMQSLAEISDHIVFPFVSYSMNENITLLKSYNPKLKISFYIDYNFYFIPKDYPFGNEYESSEIIATIENNISLANQIIVTNRELYLHLSTELSKREFIKGKGINICYQPLFFDKKILPNIPALTKKTKGQKTRFGMVLNQYHFSDFAFIKGILKEFQKKHKNEVEIVILGWDGNYKGKNYFTGLTIEHHQTVEYSDYFEKLISMNIDCFIIPAKSNKFNETSKNYIKFIEFTHLNKPVICPAITPYNLLINHNESGILCNAKEEWLHALETFLTDKPKYNGLQNNAIKSVSKIEISELSNLKILMEIYEI